MPNKLKRLFFGWEVTAPWPAVLPRGRILAETDRHMTLAFLGETSVAQLEKALLEFPGAPFKVGFTGRFDQNLFLPVRRPRVVAWHMQWLESQAQIDSLQTFQKKLVSWLVGQNLMRPDDRDLLPHVTLCRAPFVPSAWAKAFVELPFITTHIHLYESLGQLRYKPLWSCPLHAPFEEIEHTADIAFVVRGENLTQLYLHAFAALAFKHPPILKYLPKENPQALEISLDGVIKTLNIAIAQADAAGRCPLKAVSYHGELRFEADETLSWEMIVDV